MILAARPVLIGELLLDILPSGEAIPGGAPFIVAWNLRALGLNPLLISCVGQDAYGEQMLQTLQAWGLDTTGIQISPDYPTGTVRVSLQADGQPTFTIPPDQAYNFIALEPALDVIRATPAALLYHGTLAHPTPASRQMLDSLNAEVSLPIFLDPNLRDPFWDLPRLQTGLQQARWAKLNQHEFQIALQDPGLSVSQLQTVAAHACREWNLEVLMVTLGELGAVIATPTQTWVGDPVPMPHLKDTVGAGDAFSSVCLMGILNHWPWDLTLERAIAFSSRICGIAGGTSSEPEMYQSFRDHW